MTIEKYTVEFEIVFFNYSGITPSIYNFEKSLRDSPLVSTGRGTPEVSSWIYTTFQVDLGLNPAL